MSGRDQRIAGVAAVAALAVALGVGSRWGVGRAG